MKIVRCLVLPILLLAVLVQAQTSAPATHPVYQRADVAAPKAGADGVIQKRFSEMHDKFVAQAKAGGIDLLFLGDSITEGWAGSGKAVWKEKYDSMHAANFGISGDRTQHVLWRIENGELENIHPKVCVLMIGTNNIGGSAASSEPADRIAKGVKMIVDDVRTKTGAKVLLLAIFPRGMDPKDPKTIALRAKVDEINKMIATADDGKNVRYLDIGEKFLQPDGTLPKDVMPDALHPNAKGYQIWADAIDAQLKEMMQ